MAWRYADALMSGGEDGMNYFSHILNGKTSVTRAFRNVTRVNGDLRHKTAHA